MSRRSNLCSLTGSLRYVLIILSVLLIILSATAAYATAITDDVGREVTINTPVSSVVCLSPAHTEMIFWLGLENKLVAVSGQCDYPREALKTEKAGTFLNPDIEKIVKLNPGCVISGGGIQKKAIKALEKLNIPVIVMYPSGVDSVISNMELLSELLGGGKEAGKKIKKFRNDFPVAGENKVRAYLELWGKPAMGVGGSSFINSVISAAGGDNIFGDSVSEYPKVSPEEIVKRNPDVIVMLYDGEGKDRNDIKLTNAWKNNAVYSLRKDQLDTILRPGPRIIEGIKTLEKLFASGKAGAR